MAGKIGKPCREPRCPEITDGMYCDKHKHLEENHRFNFRRQPKLSFYNSIAWFKFRIFILTGRPVCQHCQRAPSNEVHHIKSARDYPELRFREDNVEALCKSCHDKESQKQAMEVRG